MVLIWLTRSIKFIWLTDISGLNETEITPRIDHRLIISPVVQYKRFRFLGRIKVNHTINVSFFNNNNFYQDPQRGEWERYRGKGCNPCTTVQPLLSDHLLTSFKVLNYMSVNCCIRYPYSTAVSIKWLQPPFCCCKFNIYCFFYPH